MKIFWTLILSTFFATSYSQILKINEPIDTDRPDKTEGVNIVPKGWLQFEAGISYQKNNDVEKEYLTPEFLSKYGVSKRIELRLITVIKTLSTQVTPFKTERESAMEIPQIGAKISLFNEKKLIPQTSLLFHVGIPGLNPYETDKFLFNSRLSMQHSISKNISLGYNIGVEFDGTSDDPVYIYTISPGFDIGKNWYAFIEAFGSLFQNEEHNIDGGLGYYINNNIKLDASAGFGISADAPKYFISFGASIRFNTKKDKF